MARVKSAQIVQKLENSSKPVSASGILTMAVLASSMLFLPGCGYFQNRHHIEVGSIPDDYRTNHPINIAEQEQFLDVPVGSSDRDLSLAQRQVIQGFTAGYRNSGSGPVQIALPSSGTNAAAAKRVAPAIAAALRKGGVPAGSVVTTGYAAPSGAASPVRVSYRMVSASTEQCGKWTDDLAITTDNKHYEDFGCSYQNNFAVQLANPADLIGPRNMSQIDAAQRDNVIKNYQDANASTSSEVDY